MRLLLGILPFSLLSLGAAPQEEDVPRLVRDLAGQLKETRTRGRALDRLMHLPVSALDEIEKCEIESSLRQAVRREIELHDRIRDSYGAPRRVTLDGRDDTVGGHLSALEKSSGFSFLKHAVDLTPRLKPVLAHASFWEALTLLAREGSMTFYPPTGDTIYLQAGAPPERPWSFHGPIAVSLERVTERRRADFERIVRETDLRLSCLWERHVTPRGLTGRYRLARAEDSAGRPLLPDVPAAMAEPERPGPGPRPHVTESFEIRGLKPLDPAVRRIALLEGSFEMIFPSRMETLTFESPLDSQPASKTLEGVRVELRHCSSSSNSVIAEFAFDFEDEKEAAAYRPNPRDIGFGAKPAAGPDLLVQIQSLRVDKDAVVFTTRAYNVADARTLKAITLRMPRGREIKHVPFRFADVEVK